MELTDEQLHMLLLCELWAVKDVSKKDTRDELKQLGLLRDVQRDEAGHYNPSTVAVWRLTALGHEVLEKNRVRALCMLTRYEVVEDHRTVLTYLSYLPVEDLPSLLTHRSKLVRAYARERVEELTNGS